MSRLASGEFATTCESRFLTSPFTERLFQGLILQRQANVGSEIEEETVQLAVSRLAAHWRRSFGQPKCTDRNIHLD